MRAGELRHQITFEQRSTAQDTFGGQSTTWSTVATVWANVQPASGRELMAAQAMQAEVSHTITVRYDPLFADPKAVAAMRIKYGTRIFDIKGVRNEDERDRRITITALEGLTQG